MSVLLQEAERYTGDVNPQGIPVFLLDSDPLDDINEELATLNLTRVKVGGRDRDCYQLSADLSSKVQEYFKRTQDEVERAAERIISLTMGMTKEELRTNRYRYASFYDYQWHFSNPDNEKWSPLSFNNIVDGLRGWHLYSSLNLLAKSDRVYAYIQPEGKVSAIHLDVDIPHLKKSSSLSMDYILHDKKRREVKQYLIGQGFYVQDSRKTGLHAFRPLSSSVNPEALSDYLWKMSGDVECLGGELDASNITGKQLPFPYLHYPHQIIGINRISALPSALTVIEEKEDEERRVVAEVEVKKTEDEEENEILLAVESFINRRCRVRSRTPYGVVDNWTAFLLAGGPRWSGMTIETAVEDVARTAPSHYSDEDKEQRVMRLIPYLKARPSIAPPLVTFPPPLPAYKSLSPNGSTKPFSRVLSETFLELSKGVYRGRNDKRDMNLLRVKTLGLALAFLDCQLRGGGYFALCLSRIRKWTGYNKDNSKVSQDILEHIRLFFPQPVYEEGTEPLVLRWYKHGKMRNAINVLHPGNVMQALLGEAPCSRRVTPLNLEECVLEPLRVPRGYSLRVYEATMEQEIESCQVYETESSEVKGPGMSITSSLNSEVPISSENGQVRYATASGCSSGGSINQMTPLSTRQPLRDYSPSITASSTTMMPLGGLLIEKCV